MVNGDTARLSAPPPPDRRRGSRLSRLVLLAGAVFGLALVPASLFESTLADAFAALAGLCFALLLFAWLARAVWRRVFWSVGRRLAVSYVLVGVLPLILIAVLVALASYLTAGFLLGHLSRDAIEDLHLDLEAAARDHLYGSYPAVRGGGELAVAEYRNGRRVEGDPEAPALWPEWMATAQRLRRLDPEERRRPFVALADGRLSVAALAGDGRRGVLVRLDGDPAAALRERSRAWFQLFRADDPSRLSTTRIQVFGRVLTFRGLWIRRTAEETAEYFRLAPPAMPGEPTWLERPIVLWMERTGDLRALADGAVVTDGVRVSLAASPTILFRTLLSASEQADSTAWVALAGIAVLLFEIWIAAAALAVFMIFGLSRAVNRLSAATRAIGRGDFGFRIPVRRRDQIGALQRSFNAMAGHLGELVETAAQKEALDKELALAREVQQNLLPEKIAARPGVEIASFFEPSAAIGGDYFDVLERPGGRLGLVIADVAGHGLAAGLRMAMVKSAFELMTDEGRPAGEMLERLHHLLRRRSGERSFVTLAFVEFDPAGGALELINAGHPPCYVVRAGGQVEELAAPGMPLGTLAGRHGRAAARLAAGDAIVLLSDGIIECSDGAGEQFGYERTQRSLAVAGAGAEALLAELLARMRAFCGEETVVDDRTAVVLTYRPPAASEAASPSRE